MIAFGLWMELVCRVYNFLKQWIETFPKDFDDELGEKVLIFINDRMATIKSMEAAAEQLKNKLLKRSENPERSTPVVNINSPTPPPILPRKNRSSGSNPANENQKYTFMDIDAGIPKKKSKELI